MSAHPTAVIVATALIAAIAASSSSSWAAPAARLASRATSSSSSSSTEAGGAIGLPPVEAPNRGARHFEDLTGNFADVTAVTVDPDDDQVIYAGNDGFLWKTDDGGESWRVILSFPRGVPDGEGGDGDDDDAGDVGDIPLEPLSPAGDAGGGAGGAGGGGAGGDGIDDLPDGDQDLVDVTAFSRAGAGVRKIELVPGSPSVFYVATPSGLFRTVSRGSSFERINLPGGADDNDVRDILVDPALPSRLYIVTAAGLIISRDGGLTVRHAEGRAGRTPGLCAAAGPDGVAILIGTERGLFRSFDGGQSFLEVLMRGLPPFFGVSAVAVSPKSGTYYAGTAEGLFVGERGAALLERFDGIPPILVEAVSPDPNLPRGVVVGTRTRGVLFSWDAGIVVDEKAEQVPAAQVLTLARGKKPYDLIVGTDRGLFRSIPGTGVTISSSALKKLRALWAKEPSLQEAAQAALDYQRVDPYEIESMQTRAAFAHLLPKLDAHFDYQKTIGDQADEVIFAAGNDLPPGVDPDAGVGTDLFGNVTALQVTPSNSETWLVFVKLTWDLDELVLNKDEVAVSRRIPQVWGVQKRIVDRVRNAFMQRRRLMTELALDQAIHGDQGIRLEVDRQIRFEELTAELDAVTGGAFSGGGQKLEDR